MIFAGQNDTHIRTGEDYGLLSLIDIFTMEPGRKAKGGGLAFIPSSYRDYNGREHAQQREHGSFVALCGDVDQGNHDRSVIEALAEQIAGGSAWLIYGSAHARPGDMRWRIIIPLDRAVSFEDWHDAQLAFFAAMEAAGVKMDHALARAAQPVYLPNVPATHVKTETPLRGDDGAPLYYERSVSGLTSKGLDITAGPVAAGMAAIRRQRAADDRERERIREEATRRRLQRPQDDSTSIIADFNASNSVASMLEICGYEQSPRSAEDWRSPNQTGETYATRIIGDKWVSLSATDTACKIGEPCSSGCFGDAYDLFVHYKHGGQHKAAFRALYAERRASNPNVIWGTFDGDIPGDPGWQEMPDGVAIEFSAEMAEVGGDPVQETSANALGFLLTDWSTDKFYGEAPPIRWLCEGSIQLGVPALFAAMGGVGKSFMALDMALEVAAEVVNGGGRRILGGPIVESGSVVVLSAEDGKDSIHRRMEKIDTGGRREGANGRLFVVPLPEVGGPMPLISGGGGDFIKTAKFDALLEQLSAITDLKLLVIDPLQAFVTADITKDPAAGQFMWSSFAQICARTGATVIACHHMRKDGAATISTVDEAREAIRGSTALIDGARATYALWGANAEETQRICLEAGVDHRPKRVVHGAVVKSNDEHDWEIHTYLRGDNGLLVDAQEAGRRAAQKAATMTEAQALATLREMATRWRKGRPFSASANTQDRFILPWMMREFNITKYVAKAQIDAWFHAEMVVSEMIDLKTKMVGLRVAKWPHMTGGSGGSLTEAPS
jgi:hypothetical protein